MIRHAEIDRNESVSHQRIFFLMPSDVSWWIWLATACLLAIGLAGFPMGYVAAIALSILQTLAHFWRERRFSAFPVQLRVAYTTLVIVCFIPHIRWLYWLPAVGTFALIIFGYCLMARFLYLLPWNRCEPITLDLVSRTFLSRPEIVDQTDGHPLEGCAGGLCSIAAQVRTAEFQTQMV